MKSLFFKILLAIGLLALSGGPGLSAVYAPAAIEYDRGYISFKTGSISLASLLSYIAQAAGAEIYVTDPVSGMVSDVRFSDTHIQDVLSILLAGRSFAVIYTPDSDKKGVVYIQPETLSIQPDRAAGMAASGMNEVLQAERPENAGQALSSGMADASAQPFGSRAEQGNLSDSGSSMTAAHSHGSRTSSAQASSLSGTLSAGYEGGVSEAAGDNSGASDPVAAEAGTEPSGQESQSQDVGTPDRAAYLSYKIQQLQEQIDSGRAQETYDFWTSKKDPKYVYNPWNELASLEEELADLQAN